MKLIIPACPRYKQIRISKRKITIIMIFFYYRERPGDVDGIATGYGLDGPGIESRWGEIFRTPPNRPGEHPVSCTMGNETFPGIKRGRGETMTPHPF
jgi:hypothetical protein